MDKPQYDKLQPSTASPLFTISLHHLIHHTGKKKSEFQGHLQWLALAFAQVHDQDGPIALRDF